VEGGFIIRQPRYVGGEIKPDFHFPTGYDPPHQREHHMSGWAPGRFLVELTGKCFALAVRTFRVCCKPVPVVIIPRTGGKIGTVEAVALHLWRTLYRRLAQQPVDAAALAARWPGGGQFWGARHGALRGGGEA
jgi:hypothetical protein